MGKKRRNIVYHYVTYDEVTKTSKCNKCGQNLRGNHGANLLRHFQNKHLPEFEKISKLNKEIKKNLQLNKAGTNERVTNCTNLENSTELPNIKVEEETVFEVVEAQGSDPLHPLQSFLQSSDDESSREVPPPPKKDIRVSRTDFAQASSSNIAPDQKNSTTFKAEAASSPRHGIREDQFDFFGKNVASKLRNIAQNDNTQRLMAEKIVNDALFFAELGQLTFAHCNKLHSE